MAVRDVKALTFDVFGTVVNWRDSIAREAKAILGPKGYDKDWHAFADQWRARYQPAMAKVRNGERPWARLDDLHRENLVELLPEFGIIGLGEAEIDHLNRAWHRLDGWPDTVEGLTRLKRKFILATLSNGNVALMVNMAKYAGLPWDAILGAEVAHAYKPQPEAYDRTAAFLDLEARRVHDGRGSQWRSRRGARPRLSHRLCQPAVGARPEQDPRRQSRARFRRDRRQLYRPRRQARLLTDAADRQAARGNVSRSHTSARPATSASMSASLCSGVGVRRSRSLPRGTVG